MGLFDLFRDVFGRKHVRGSVHFRHSRQHQSRLGPKCNVDWKTPRTRTCHVHERVNVPAPWHTRRHVVLHQKVDDGMYVPAQIRGLTRTNGDAFSLASVKATAGHGRRQVGSGHDGVQVQRSARLRRSDRDTPRCGLGETAQDRHALRQSVVLQSRHRLQTLFALSTHALLLEVRALPF